MTEKKKLKQFKKIVWKYYKEHGRHALPWRKTKNPYRILVSEVMLQQTQVARVVPKYQEFLKHFPTIQKLAEAPLGEVLLYWQGLGYNRRAKALQELAQTVVRDYKAKMPREYSELLMLPGIGPYTAGAVCAFAYNTPVAMLETNIRTVLFQHLVLGEERVSDTELLRIAEDVLDTARPREWHYALMDYGAYLKGKGVRSNHKSKHYVKQKPFKGSDREVRGAIIRALATTESMTLAMLVTATKIEKDRVQKQIQKLHTEGLIQKRRNRCYL